MIKFIGRSLKNTFGFALALLLLFEMWGKEALSAALGFVVRHTPLAYLKPWLLSLSPYPSLALLGLPAVCLLPVKLFAIYLFASGHYGMGLTLIIAAKIIGTAIVATLYGLLEHKLVQIGWFKWLRDFIVPKIAYMTAWIRQSWAWRFGRFVKSAVKRKVAAFKAAVRRRFVHVFG